MQINDRKIFQILVVDDEALVRRLIRRILEHEGYEILEAENGIEACDLLKGNNPGLMITDLKMPVMDGFETIKEARRMTPNIKIIAVSGDNIAHPKSHIPDSGKFGADNVINKPFEAGALRAMVRELLNN